MSVVKGSEDENREGEKDGSRVVKIFELDAAQAFVGLDWLCNGSHTRRRRRQEKEDGKKGATSAHGNRPSGSDSENQQRQQQQQQ